MTLSTYSDNELRQIAGVSTGLFDDLIPHTRPTENDIIIIILFAIISVFLLRRSSREWLVKRATWFVNRERHKGFRRLFIIIASLLSVAGALTVLPKIKEPFEIGLLALYMIVIMFVSFGACAFAKAVLLWLIDGFRSDSDQKS